nr:methyl-accepting chemotaxis protein [uncultured Rhodopila sp.]
MGALLARCRVGCQIAILGLIGITGVLAIAGINVWGSRQIDLTNAAMTAARQARDLETTAQIALLQARRQEKNFLLRHDETSVAQQANSTAAALKALHALSQRVAEQPELAGAARQMIEDTRQYASLFDGVVSQGRTAGLTENQGLLGALRANIHDVEDKLKPVGSAAAQIAMLTMRRYEKDFITRLDPKYGEQLKAAQPEFVAAINAAAMPETVRKDILASMDAYQESFARFMSGTLAQARSIDRLIDVSRGIEPHLAAADRKFAEQAEAAEVEATAIAARIHQTVAVSLGLITVLVVGLSWISGRNIGRPIIAVTRSMESLVRGDLTTPVPTDQRRDEIGTMIQVVGVLKDSLVAAQRMRQEQDAARERAELDKRAALTAMADRIEREAAAAVHQIGERTVAMTATAGQMRDLAGRTGVAAETAASAAALALGNAQAVASAAEELSASIREISSQVAQSTTVVGQAVQAGTETRAAIEALNEQVGRIGLVADSIGAIAAKTNLLALNATIEAARAGEAGKGFAVVAGEVKQLATQTARSTEEITRRVNEVRLATGVAVGAVQRIGTTINDVSDIAGAIAAAVEEQGAATAEIARNVAETASAVNEMTSRNTDVSGEAEKAGRYAGDVLESTKILDGAVSELQRAITRTVRTSTEEADRRLFKRHAVDLGCRIEGAGATQSARIREISEGGARLTGTAGLSAGGRATLRIDGLSAQIGLTIVGTEGDDLRVSFEPDEAARLGIRALVERTAFKSAA